MRRIASLVLWFLALWGLWLVLVGTRLTLEVIAGACAAAVGAAFAEVLRSRGLLAYELDPGLLAKGLKLVWLVPADFALATWVLVAAAARGRRVRGEWVRVPFALGTGPRRRWQRAFAITASNGAVNALVVDLGDREATMHALDPKARSGRQVL